MLALALVSCRGGRQVGAFTVATGGDPARGRALVTERHCGVCHEIPNVVGAAGVIGPSLAGVGRQSFIAAGLPNTPENLERWLRDPVGIDHDTPMPALALDGPQATDVAAYLYTLTEDRR